MGAHSSKLVFLAIVIGVTPAFGQKKTETSRQPERPFLIYAEVPFYPPVARAARVSGTVTIEVNVERGMVIDAKLRSSSSPLELLSTWALRNVRTWKFTPEGHMEFLVTYIYRIGGKETDRVEDAQVDFRPPHLVRIRARPVKPTRS